MGIPTFTPYKLPGDAQTPVTAFDFQKAQDQIALTLNALVKAVGDFRPGSFQPGDLAAYQLLAEKAAASGYCDLDSSTQVPNARVKWDAPSAIGGTTPDAGTFTDLTCDVGGLLGGNPLLHVREEQTSGTNGGTFTSGAWRTRTLNTSKTNEISGASLGSNQITLPAGTYWIEASAPGFVVVFHKAKLYNITDSADVIIGTNCQTGAGDSVLTRSLVRGRFTIAAQKVFELQHRCSSTLATTGFGQANSFSVVEVYSEVMIWKLA